MTLTTAEPSTASTNRLAKWGAFASGIVGLMAAGFIIGADQLAHINLDLGTFIGKPLYPLWVLLVARRL